MIREAYRVVAMAAAIFVADASFAEEAVLYWMVDSSAEVTTPGVGDNPATTQGLTSFISSKPAESEDSWYAARIRVTGGDITEPTFLTLYSSDGPTESGELGVWLGDNGGGFWGAGVPSGNQSSVGNYSAGSPEYCFTVEIGNVQWDETSGTSSWVETLATSATVAYSALGTYIGETFDLSPQRDMVWTPTAFNEVPEPSSGLLLLVGGGLLFLRRRRAGVA